MKILVIDDSPIHQESARQTIKEHDLTVVGTYDEAYELLERPYAKYSDVNAGLIRMGFRANRWENPETRHNEYDREEERLKEELRPAPFDAVLTDLFMPAGSRIQVKGGEFVGQEMLVGFALALDAVLHGAKYVAVVSDGNHHHHPGVAMLDRLGDYHPWDDKHPVPVRFEINRAHVGFFRVSCGKDGKNWGEI
ncbi:MAG: hypothetical protein COY69_02560, partial [Candidatus Magasanikbacteria bacterium CG_4_10_14_0_8_um_filter_32_14]